MKIQMYVINLLISLSIFGCLQNSYEKDLNGRWYGIENNGYTRMHFYPDSLIYKEYDTEKVKWKATRSEIKFDFPTIISDSTGALDIIQDKITIQYQLSEDKDTLLGNFKNLFGENKLSLLRAKNYIEFLNKKYKVEFSLPDDDNSERLLKRDEIYGLNVFIGYSNSKIIGKTELSENLHHLESDIKKFKDNIRPYTKFQIETHKEWLDYGFHLRVFADKRISDSIITNYLSVIIKSEKSTFTEGLPEKNRNSVRDTLPIKIYRIYQSEEEVEFSKIKGKEIKSLAKYVYY